MVTASYTMNKSIILGNYIFHFDSWDDFFIIIPSCNNFPLIIPDFFSFWAPSWMRYRAALSSLSKGAKKFGLLPTKEVLHRSDLVGQARVSIYMFLVIY